MMNHTHATSYADNIQRARRAEAEAHRLRRLARTRRRDTSCL
jgi:hypothetical protein